MNQLKRIEIPKINPDIYNNAKNTYAEGMLSSLNGVGETVYPHGEE
jgi:hypothetical protein